MAETAPVAGLLALVLLLVTRGDAVLAYTRATAQTLHTPERYIEAVMGAQPRLRKPEGSR